VLEMLIYSVRSFVRGKLFRDNGAALRQWLKGFSLTLGLLLAIGYFAGPLAGVVVSSLIGGAAQPYLFRDIKYA